MRDAYRIVLADDHAMFRKGVGRILKDVDGLQVVGEAGDGLELLNLLNSIEVDMVVLDISMPNLRGVEAAREIKSLHPDIKILFLTMYNDPEYFYHALSAGASGYLLKEDADEELLSAIKTIRKGKVYISPIITSDLPNQLGRFYTEGQDPVFETLTRREKEVLKLIAEGKTSKEIADLFYISARTVQHHRANLMSKLKIKTTAELVKYAIKKGLVGINHSG